MSPSTANGWQWDSHRKAYCFWSANENSWIYEDGTRLPYASATPQAFYGNGNSRPANPPQAAQAVQSAAGNGNSALVNQFSNLTINQAYPTQSYAQTNGATVAYAQTTYTSYQPSYQPHTAPSAYSYGANQPWPSNQSTRQPQSAGYAQSGSGYAQSGSGYAQSGSGQPIANVQRVSDNQVWLKGSNGEQETLDPRYHIRRPGNKFFIFGKVFKILWPELAGSTDVQTSISSNNRYQEPIFYKVRWFVVVVEGKNYCTCLSIQTYGRRGVAKPGIPKNEHAIIFTTSTEPRPQLAERPQSEHEGGMLSPIGVNANYNGELDIMSRLNFGKIYTVEHNVKVFDFGQVRAEYGLVLQRQFRDVFNRRMQSTAYPVGTIQTIHEGDEDDVDDDEESDSSSEEEAVIEHPRRRERRASQRSGRRRR